MRWRDVHVAAPSVPPGSGQCGGNVARLPPRKMRSKVGGVQSTEQRPLGNSADRHARPALPQAVASVGGESIGGDALPRTGAYSVERAS